MYQKNAINYATATYYLLSKDNLYNIPKAKKG